MCLQSLDRLKFEYAGQLEAWSAYVCKYSASVCVCVCGHVCKYSASVVCVLKLVAMYVSIALVCDCGLSFISTGSGLNTISKLN